jgi:outer membrane protein assembly factor BamB
MSRVNARRAVTRGARAVRVCVGLLIISCCPVSWQANAQSTATSFLQRPDAAIESVPQRWSPDNIVWQVELPGYGQSEPQLFGERMYVTSVVGTNKEEGCVTCLSVGGELLWQQRVPLSFTAESTPMVSRAAPTPAVDAAGVYVLFESGDFLAWRHDGTPLWQRSLQTEYGAFDNKFGLAASVAQTEKHCLVLLEHHGPSVLIAVEKSTGENAWIQSRGNKGHSWTSPAIVVCEDQSYVVVSSLGSIDVYDAGTGQKVAETTDIGGNSVATPIDFGQGRFLISSLIRPADGPVSGATRSNRLMQLQRTDAGVSLQERWIAENARGGFGSPIIAGAYAYWITPQGVLHCLDAETGAEHYAERLKCGGCWATPFVVGQHLYCFGKDGLGMVVQTGDLFRVVSEDNHLWPDEKQNLYAVVPLPGALIVRSGNRVYRVE